jgi:hypothetical protein
LLPVLVAQRRCQRQKSVLTTAALNCPLSPPIQGFTANAPWGPVLRLLTTKAGDLQGKLQHQALQSVSRKWHHVAARCALDQRHYVRAHCLENALVLFRILVAIVDAGDAALLMILDAVHGLASET